MILRSNSRRICLPILRDRRFLVHSVITVGRAFLPPRRHSCRHIADFLSTQRQAASKGGSQAGMPAPPVLPSV